MKDETPMEMCRHIHIFSCTKQTLTEDSSTVGDTSRLHSPWCSKSGAGEVELSSFEGDEERTLGGEMFAPVGERAAGQSQRLLGNKTTTGSTTFTTDHTDVCRLKLSEIFNQRWTTTAVKTKLLTDLDLLQDFGGDLLTGELFWRRIKLQLVYICTKKIKRYKKFIIKAQGRVQTVSGSVHLRKKIIPHKPKINLIKKSGTK